MKKVLIWSCHFPPEGGPGVQRISKLIKKFPEGKLEIYVLTSERNFKVVDQTLLDEIQKKCTIVRVKDRYSYLRGGIKNTLSWVCIPDKALYWSVNAYSMAKQLQRFVGFDLVISTSPPHSSHIFATKFANKMNLPLIIEYRDEWTGNSLFHKYKWKQIHKIQEQRVLKAMDTLVTISETSKRNFLKLGVNPEKIVIIPNGFDQDDFSPLDVSSKTTDCLTFGYIGRFNSLHSPISFFKGITAIKSDLPIQCEVIGGIQNSKWVKDFPNLKEDVHFKDYLPHKECLQEMAKTNILLLLSTNSNQTEVITGKVFEYFGMRMPIFAIISSKGELYKMLSEYQNSYIAFDNDPDSITIALERLISEYKIGRISKDVNEKFVEKFNRQAQAKRYLEIIEELTNA